MSDLVLNNITSGYNLNLINENFTSIQDRINNYCLQNKEGKNVLNQDVDMNGYALLNLEANWSNNGSMVTVGDAKAHFYQIGLVPSATVDTDAVNLGQVSQMIDAASVGTDPPNVALYSDLAQSAGSSLIGYSGGGTVQDKLGSLDADLSTLDADLSALSVSLSGDNGASQVGYKSPLTNSIRLTLKQLLDSSEYHSSWFGADNTGATSATAALQALVYAATAAGKKAVIDSGSYLISGSVGVKLPSNAFVVAYGATFNRGTPGTEIFRNDADGITGAYAANTNITIMGGTYDGRHDLFPIVSGTLIAIGHCSNVLIKDAVLKNTTGSHYIELNASQYCEVESCTFSGGAEQALTTMEAIQIDSASGSAAFPWFGPYDNTPCNSISIRDCTFLSCGTGVGTHLDPSSQHTNLAITGCVIRGSYYAGIRGQGWSGVTITNNKINGGHHGIILSPAASFSCNNYVISNNTVEEMGNSGYNPGAGALGRGINIGSVSGKVINIVAITGNTVRNINGTYSSHGIYLNGAQKLTVTGNVVDVVSSNGLYLDGCSYGCVNGNETTLASGTSFVASGCTELAMGYNRGATASVTGSTKIAFACNIWGTSQTLSSNTGLIGPNLVNGVST